MASSGLEQSIDEYNFRITKENQRELKKARHLTSAEITTLFKTTMERIEKERIKKIQDQLAAAGSNDEDKEEEEIATTIVDPQLLEKTFKNIRIIIRFCDDNIKNIQECKKVDQKFKNNIIDSLKSIKVTFSNFENLSQT